MAYSIKDFSLDEKLKLLSGKNKWSTEDFQGRLYEVVVSDGPVGLRKVVCDESGEPHELPAVAYPACAVLSQTWEPTLAYKLGECLADDCIERDVDILLAPGVNIKRSPLCGRNFEYFSEDPLVTGLFGREYVAGVQSRRVGACLKHYCANNLETRRLWTSSEVDERTLREIYLQPFRLACEANPISVMCSYNLVNGQRMSEHKKLYDILRKEFWREDGVIFSDWGAVQDEAASVRAGLDIAMPYKSDGFTALKDAYARSELTEEEIDACVGRVLGLISHCKKNSKNRRVKSTVDERRAVAEQVAREGIVLLKNNGILPLKEASVITVAGLEPDQYYCGKGSSCITQHGKVRTLTEVLKDMCPSAEIRITRANGRSSVHERNRSNAVTIVVCGDAETEGADRETMSVSKEEESLILQCAQRNPNTVVVLRYGAAVETSNWIDKVAAIVWAGYGGERCNEALVDILLGKVSPSGRLTETFARSYEDYPVAHTYLTSAVNVYSEGLSVGYRYFDRAPEKVAFPFGYGLTYASFAYSNLQIKEREGSYLVSFDVENLSQTDGAEVAQVYVREQFAKVYRPIKELKGFQKVWIRAGERKRVEISLNREDFAYYSVAKDCWTAQQGTFELLVGKNAQDICLRAELKIK